MGCTTLLVGKDASYDGSTIVTRSEDSPSGIFTAKHFIVVKPEDQPRQYKSVITECEIDLPDNPLRYTCLPDADRSKGIWGAAGINELNVAMTATETLSTNARVQGADPLLAGTKQEKGIGEEDFVTLVLPYIRSARQGVERLGHLLETYGTYEANGIAFQDVDEIWWLETIGGHHWMARRVPDNAYVVMPNQLGIDQFDFEDAAGDQKNFMCSKDLKEWSQRYHMNLGREGETFNPRLAFGSRMDADHVYNTPRAWMMLRYFNPRTYSWDGPEAEFRPEDDDLPWCLEPETKISIEAIKWVLSSHYQGTPYDCYGKYGDPAERGKYRPIGISRQNVTAYTQIRPYLPEAIRSIQWLSFGSNPFNAIVPFYTNVNQTPAYLSQPARQVTTESFYWANRLIAAICDTHFYKTDKFVGRYQNAVVNKGHYLINQTDQRYLDKQGEDQPIQAMLEEANQAMADYVQQATNELLDKVLYVASCEMKNGYALSDN